MKDMTEIIEQVKKNSIVEEKIKIKRTKKKISAKTILIATMLLISMSFTACSFRKNNDNVIVDQQTTIVQEKKVSDYLLMNQEQEDYRRGVNNSVALIFAAEKKLEENGIDYKGYVNNDVSEYKKIPDLKESDIFGFYKLLGKQESEKVVQALGYSGWNEFLIKKRAVNEKGEPVFVIWENNEYTEYGRQLREASEKTYDEGSSYSK